ncbi:MAG: hypothetical protein ACSW8F_00700 [bacterium]
MREKVQVYAIFITVFVLLFNVLDLVFSLLVTRSGYRFAPVENLVLPLIIGAVIATMLLRGRKEE